MNRRCLLRSGSRVRILPDAQAQDLFLRSPDYPLSQRVVSITPADPENMRRLVGVADGASKFTAIRAARRGPSFTLPSPPAP
ncbi:MAG: hypothetical protein WCB92_20225 [Mycobacterium sp.]